MRKEGGQKSRRDDILASRAPGIRETKQTRLDISGSNALLPVLVIETY